MSLSLCHSFSHCLPSPLGTELHKTSPCFIQWCEGESERGERGEEEERGEGGEGGERGEGGEEEGVMWGLNFMSGEDAMKFLKACTVSEVIS